MSSGLYLCAHAAEFPAQALLRLRADWQTNAVVVMDGSAPQEWVCSMNRLAEQRGVAVGMTRLEAESVTGLRLLKRSAENETAARKVFLECAAKFSPRIEEAGLTEAQSIGIDRFSQASKCKGSAAPIPTEYALVLDIAGTERLFGRPVQLAERVRDELAEAGFRASVAVSANYDAARMKAAEIRGIAVIPEGEEARALAKLPLAALGLDEDYAATFALWGIGTLGELATLPEADLVARMGPVARRWRALAQGAAEHPFVPIEPEFTLEEFCEFEMPVEQIDSLLFVGARMIDCLVMRASGRALALQSLMAEMRLEGGSEHRCSIRPAVPSTDRKFLLKLLQLELGAHPPQAGVMALTLRAEAGQTNQVQLGLFTPETPEPSRLDVTLARLRALVGEERVGSPVLEDTHRPGAFRMERFLNPGLKSDTVSTRSFTDAPRMALRRVRPARMVRVETQGTRGRATPTGTNHPAGNKGTRPVAFRDGEQTYTVAAAYGPWRTSGCWWAVNTWDTEEWDVLAVCAKKLPSEANQSATIQFVSEKQPQIVRLAPVARYDRWETVACLMVYDRTRNAWLLDAYYD